jgi:hypothetical protein
LHIIAGIALAIGLMAPHFLQAQDRSATVVELYTSQGCSSCPPADAYLARLARQPGVIALALHVDYWDYLGWTDDFGHAQFSDRQRAYAHALGLASIYTPQMIVGGVEQAAGSDPGQVARLIGGQRTDGEQIGLQLRREGGQVSIQALPGARGAGPLVVQLVRYLPSQRVMIEQGENAGRTIDYVNIVTSWSRIGLWDGRGALEMTVPAAGPEAVVVILQDEGPGAIRAAAVLE